MIPSRESAQEHVTAVLIQERSQGSLKVKKDKEVTIYFGRHYPFNMFPLQC